MKIGIARAGRQNVSGILLGNQQIATLKLAFQLQPGVQRVVAVAGTTPLERFWINQLEKDLALSQPGITFTYLNNMSMDDIFEKGVSPASAHSHLLPIFLLRREREYVFTGGSTGFDQRGSCRAGLRQFPFLYWTWIGRTTGAGFRG